MRHLASTPTVLRFSLRPVPVPSAEKPVPKQTPPAPAVQPAPEGANGLWPWKPVAPLIAGAIGRPPRPWRALALVRPLAKKYEYIGLMSRPFIGVTSAEKISAKSSPRAWAMHGICVALPLPRHLLPVLPPS